MKKSLRILNTRSNVYIFFSVIITILLLIPLSPSLKAQAMGPTVCPINAGPDVSICTPNCATLTGTYVATKATTSYVVAAVPYAPDPYNAGTAITLWDDQWSGVINIPFTFCFYGNAYTQCLIGSNGLITFNLGTAGGYCPWPIPATNAPTATYGWSNGIGGPWQDLYPPGGGTVRYATYGTAPCRRFVVSWYNMPMYSCTSTLLTQQITLYETTNVIDNYIQVRSSCSWNSGRAVQLIMNNGGTAATVVAGRNALNAGWTTVNNGQRYTPNGVSTVTTGWYVGAVLVSAANPFVACPLATTTYTFRATYTNCNGATVAVSDNVIVTVSSLTLSQTQTNLTCNAVCTGTAGVTVTSGTGPFTYLWAPAPGGGQGTANATGLCAGTYSCTVTGAGGCTGQATFNITQPPAITLTPTQTNVLCNGTCTGVASVAATGGTGVYTYTWAPVPPLGQGTATASGLCAGTYTVTVSSPAGCTRTQAFTITQPPALTSTGTQTNVLCNGVCTGSAQVTPSGGVGPYTYLWAPSGGTAATASALCAGTYTVTYTDANGCTGTRTFNITQPPALTTTGSQTNILCNGACTGSASVTASGGTGPYSYSWAPSGGTGASTTGRCAGTYTVTVTDANGCTTTRTFSITQPPALATTQSQTNILCNGACTGSAQVTPSGGTAPYTYAWTPSGGTAATTTGRCAGTYTVTVTDANGCTTTATFNITQPPALATTGSQTNILCNAACTGQASVTASGGTAPYSYSWAPVGGTGSSATALCAGTYTVTVTDANGCTITRTYTITQPPALTTTGTQTNVTCNAVCNGSAQVTAAGGTGPYTYLWAPSGGTAATASSLCAGTYTVTVTDANGCTTTRSFTITQPPAITLTPTQTNIACFGGTGTASVTATGGTGTYTYAWAPSGGTGASATGLAAGTYTVTVSSPAGCTATQTFSITQPPAITLTPTQTNILCNGAATGSASVTASGGTGTYTYAWAPSGGTGASATGLLAGTYTVTVTSGPVGCTATQTFNITQVPAITLVPTQTNVLCNGAATGSASVTASGGTGTYTYSWAPSGGSGASATGLLAGTYTVTVTSGPVGCTATQTFNITQPTALAATTSFTQATCNMSNGSASVTVTGGVGPYTYSWAPSGGTAALTTGRPAGIYTVTFTDANGCTGTATVNIPNAAAPTISITSTTNVSCFGGNNGSAVSSATGGTSPYTYAWAPIGGTGSTGTNLTAQNYTVTVTDANGCTASATTTITQPPVLAATASMTPVLCSGGNTGTATGTATGGVGPYSYSWNPSSQTTATATNLTAQTYTITVTDANGCTTTATTTVTQPTAVTATASMTPVLCNGGNTGTATATAAGGIGPYTYSWSPSAQTTATATALTAQSYTVTVTDANGCTVTASVTVTQPPALAATTTFTQATCSASNGAAAVSVTGGVGPYTYSWAPTGGTGATAAGLPAQGYTVTFTDANGCTGTASVNVPNAASPSITIVSTTNVSCFGGNNGSATTTASGGTSPYTYAWAPIGGTGSTGTSLTAQNYTVTVTDANGCTATATTTITEPPLLTATATMSPVLCNGGNTGSATASPTGGVGPYTYLWNPSSQTTVTATNLTAQSYTVTVTDANGCTTTASTTVTEPTPVTATASMTPVLCNGGNTGTATATAAGGIGPYTYSWSPSAQTTATATALTAQGYTVTVTDANGCTVTATVTVTEPTALAATTSFTQSTCSAANGAADVTVTGGIGPYTYNWAPTGGTGSTATGLSAQGYTVTFTDANGCTGTASVNVLNAASPSVTIVSTTDVSCFGGNNGSAVSSATGGTSPYTYAWAPIGGTGSTGTNLTAQSYTVTVTDANGCTATATTTITEPPLLTATATMSPVLCNGGNTGSATASPTGGVGPYTYSWTPSSQTTQTATNLTAQSYTVTVTDANGCTTTASTTITEPTAVTATATMSPVLCNGGNTGSATVAPSGGIGPYTYLWSPSAQTTITATGLTAQPYTVVVTDANGCTFTASITVTEPTALAATTSFTQATCSAANGSADVTVTGGIGPYTYSWAPTGGTAALATGLTAQTYTVTYTDANGCSDTAQVTVPNAASPSITVTGTTAVTCFGGADGTATSVASGGTAPYTYAWALTGGTGAVGTGMIAGNYTVTVTDANGCTATATTTITEPTLVTATSSTTDVICNGGATGTATAVGAGGIGPYTYSWNPSAQTTATATGLTAQSYTCTVTDANGCSTTTSVTVVEPTQVTSTISGIDILCNGGNNGSATVTPSGGIGPYTYNWMPTAQTTQTAINLTAQAYTCDITDANGCSITLSITLTEPPALAATTSFTQSTCSQANGSADVTVTGGVGPYTYSWAPTGGTAALATGLSAQSYTVTFTDANGCIDTAQVTVPNAASPSITITGTTAVTCFGGADGTATSVTTGGTAPYTYVWALTGGTGAVGTGMIAGNYTVTVTDANSCTATATTTITEPTLVTATSSTTDVICNGGATGTATAVGAGGIGPYSYSWNPSAQTTDTATGLTAQSYTCTVTDANGCSTTTSVTVVEPTAVAATISGVDILCNGNNTGSATVTPSGGIGPYTYNWMPSAQTTQTAINLTAQAYTCDITDANGCSITMSITLTEPPVLAATTSFTQSTCGASNGSADVTPTGGVGPYTYLWSSSGTGQTETGLAAGPYTVDVTDANGCSITASVTVPSAPGPVAVIGAPTPVLCFGGNTGQAVASVSSGGTAPFTYLWSNADPDSVAQSLIAGSYSVLITDANGCTSTATVLITEPTMLNLQANATPAVVCEGTPVQLSGVAGGGVGPYQYDWMAPAMSGANQTVTPLITTTYTLTVTDANGCTTSQPVLVTVNPLPVATISSDVQSGCAPVTVNFSDLSTISSGSITGWSWDLDDNATSSSQNPSHQYLTPGQYTIVLTVTSAAGCTNTITMANYVEVFANPIAAFGASPQPTTMVNPEICFTDSSIGATDYMWNFGDINGSSSTDQNPCFIYPDPTCYLVTLTVSTPNGCTDQDTQTVCIAPDVSIYVPNTFTPDGNDLNDVFIPVTIGVDPEQYELWVFDRWGNLIWYTNDLGEGWDGRVQGHSDICQVDTYVWKIVAKDIMGGQHNLIGHVNLIK